MPTDLMWFRRDLRVADHPALSTAAGADQLTCLFVLDAAILAGDRISPARTTYLRHALADLAGRLADRGNRLLVLAGDPVAVVPQVAHDVDATTVHICDDHTPAARRRDAAVAAALAADDRQLHRHGGVAIVAPGTVRTQSGSAYQVFTPFHRSWRQAAHGDPLPAPAVLPPAPPTSPTGVAVADHPLLQADPPPQPWTTAGPADGGESAARVRLDAWLADGVDGYDQRRDVVGADGTSRLSADLHFGCLSAREVWSRLDRRRDAHATYATELAWRDFYQHVMAEWPHAASRAFRDELADLPWHDDAQGLAAWQDGQTGYPLVDAAMRQLRQIGWMHNRARMVVASFLSKDLLIDWRRGEAHFMRHLVDGDVASNNGGWQWAAGTGTDAQPFFRIFNPVAQGRRFDPDGTYVHRWVPELADVPAPAVHEPWTLSPANQERFGVRIGVDYPAPIVDHAEARDRALAWFQAHRG